ncbi:MAG TPA: FkbM family methyltransferase [Chitinophagaceae bacterium]|nr:FkbM family methyltransferase [Chitinophagaceae bacterium]
MFTNKEYDAIFSFLFSSPLRDPLIIDLGANVGYFSLRVADELIMSQYKDFRIIALEGTPVNYHILSRRLDQSVLKNRIESFCGLAGHKTGDGKIARTAMHFGHSVVESGTAVKADTVKYINIDDLIPNSTERIALLKCDIEGSEEIFILNYSDLLRKVDNAVFEFHATSCNVENCRSHLRQVGLISKGILKEEKEYNTCVEIFSRI